MKKLFAAAFVITVAAPVAQAEEPDGLILPPGFHASVVADGLGPIRHLAVRGNGDIFVSTRHGAGQPTTGIIALRLGPDHKAVQTTHFSEVDQGTGIRFHLGYLYASSNNAVYRFAFNANDLVPAAAPEAIVTGLPNSNHAIAFDEHGGLYVSVDGGGNICTDPKAPKDTKPVGLKPCPLLEGHAGVWRFSDTKSGQNFTDGERYATGIRNMSAMDWRSNDALYGAMHGRDGTHNAFPDLVSASDDDAISDEMHRVVKGTDFGWPYSYYDGARKVRLLAPEYGGDGKATAEGDTPVVSFQPQRPAVLDLVFYGGRKFPARYQGGPLSPCMAARARARIRAMTSSLCRSRPAREHRRYLPTASPVRRRRTKTSSGQPIARWGWRWDQTAHCMWPILRRAASGVSPMASDQPPLANSG